MTRHTIAFSISFVLHMVGIIYYLYHPAMLFPTNKSEPKSMSIHILTLIPESIQIQEAQPTAQIPNATKQLHTKHLAIAQLNASSDSVSKPLPTKKKNTSKKEHPLEGSSDTNVSAPHSEASSSTQEAQTLSSNDTAHPNINFQEITQVIEKMKTYPEKARKRNIEGVVNVTFVLTPSGEIESLESLSHSTLLANSAKETVLKAKAFFPLPYTRTTINIPLIYTLK